MSNGRVVRRTGRTIDHTGCVLHWFCLEPIMQTWRIWSRVGRRVTIRRWRRRHLLRQAKEVRGLVSSERPSAQRFNIVLTTQGATESRGPKELLGRRTGSESEAHWSTSEIRHPQCCGLWSCLRLEHYHHTNAWFAKSEFVSNPTPKLCTIVPLRN